MSKGQSNFAIISAGLLVLFQLLVFNYIQELNDFGQHRLYVLFNILALGCSVLTFFFVRISVNSLNIPGTHMFGDVILGIHGLNLIIAILLWRGMIGFDYYNTISYFTRMSLLVYVYYYGKILLSKGDRHLWLKMHAGLIAAYALLSFASIQFPTFVQINSYYTYLILIAGNLILPVAFYKFGNKDQEEVFTDDNVLDS